MPELLINFSDAAAKSRLIAQLQALDGKYRVSVKKERHGRTLAQNRFMWAIVYPAVCQGISEAWGESMTVDECHIFCKNLFLARPIVNRNTGEVMGNTHMRPSSAVLSVPEFAEYLNKIQRMASEMLGVVVPSPDTLAEFKG